MSTVQLGATYVDKITGFVGIAIGHCIYLTGCNQTLLQPVKPGETSVRLTSEWFDDQRLEHLSREKVMTLDNGTTPGCDRAAPKR